MSIVDVLGAVGAFMSIGGGLGGAAATIGKNDANMGSAIGTCVGAVIGLVTGLIASAGQAGDQHR